RRGAHPNVPLDAPTPTVDRPAWGFRGSSRARPHSICGRGLRSAGPRRRHAHRLLHRPEGQGVGVAQLTDLLTERLGLADVVELALAVDRWPARPAAGLTLEPFGQVPELVG